MVSLKHKFQTAKGDGPDSTFVKPSDWNDEHEIWLTSNMVYLGHAGSPPGPDGATLQELPIDGAGSGDYTMLTKFRVQELIAAAVAAISQPATGDLCASLAATKSGWVLANGQVLKLGNGESNHALFDLLWAINGNTWPVYTSGTTTPNRGASAAADWAANKDIPVPDARGCVVGMVDGGANVNTLLTLLGVKVGEQNHVLTVPEMPSHTHTAVQCIDPVQGGSGGAFNVNNTLTATPTGATGGGLAHNIVQPTVGANIFIKL